MERNVVFIALFAALIAVLGLIPPITLPIGVPITAQSLGVMLCGTILGAKRGGLAVLLFVVLAIVLPMPLLSGGRTGLASLASPAAGFLLAWPIAAFVTGLIVERVRSIPFTIVAMVAAVVGCILVLYIFGIVGIAIKANIGIDKAAASVLAFVPGDIVKAVIAGLISGALLKARPQSVLSRSLNTQA